MQDKTVNKRASIINSSFFISFTINNMIKLYIIFKIISIIS